ncbi:amidohydrolase family protein [Candidatus Altiarchaeota archaeon]
MTITYNASLITGERPEFIEECHLVIEGEEIVEVGNGQVSDGLDFAEYVILPSLFNAHVHLGDSFAKEGVLGLNPEQAVGPEGKKWELFKQKNADVQKEAIKETLDYMLSSGTRGCVDFREEGKEGVRILREVSKEVPLEVIILGREDGIEEADGAGLNVYGIGQVPSNIKVAIHAGEDRGEVEKALKHDPDTIVHFTKGTKEDVLDAASKGVSVVVCPRANAALGVGFPPIRELLDAGVKVALGTDNVMVNQPNLWREMEYLSKTSYVHEPVTPEEVFSMATLNGNKIFGLEGGVIGEGKRADLIFLDKRAANLRHTKNPLATIIHRTEPENVMKVMVAGKIVLDKEAK